MTATDQYLKLSSSTDEIDLYTWVTHGVNAPGFEALAGITGFGMTDQQNTWFEGAGDGSQWQGSRILSRRLILPLWARAHNRAALNELLKRLSLMLRPKVGPARLTFGLPGGELWYIDVIREAGGDYVRKSKTGSDNQKWLRSSLTLRAGDPYWTRNNAESFAVTEDVSGRGLLPDLAELQLSFSGAFGNLTLNNPGDGDADLFWTLKGPFTRVELIGPELRSLVWEGIVLEGETLYINTRNGGTVIDNTGANRYDGLDTLPQFWKLPPGATNVTITLDGTTASSLAVGQFWPRRWAVI